MAITSTANTALLCSLSIYASYTISHNTAIERKKVKSLNHVRLFATLWTVAYQAPPSMEFSWQEYWSWEVGCHFLLQGIYLTQGWNSRALHCRRFFTAETPGKPRVTCIVRAKSSLLRDWGTSAPCLGHERNQAQDLCMWLSLQTLLRSPTVD